jgi:uncharacterized protein YbjT (DUF2867 family)
MEARTAIVFGATGLVGTALLSELCKSDLYGMIRIFARRETGFSGNEKVKEFIIDFSNLKDYAGLIKGDDLFICLGTTIKKAGSVLRMEEIDRDLPLEIAALASANSVEKLAVVSSLGANSNSTNYYLRIKGEMEKGLLRLNFRTLVILRPSILFGERAEKRIGEEIGKIFMKLSGIFLIGKLKKYRGIEGRKVAIAMIIAVNGKPGMEILESDAIHKIAGYK